MDVFPSSKYKIQPLRFAGRVAQAVLDLGPAVPPPKWYSLISEYTYILYPCWLWSVVSALSYCP